jgi:hypothetical protein
MAGAINAIDIATNAKASLGDAIRSAPHILIVQALACLAAMMADTGLN